MGRPRKSQITVTPRATTNAALLRRLHGNPHGSGTRTLPLKEPEQWQTYIANTLQDPNAFWNMKERGWVPLTEEDLHCPASEAGFEVGPGGVLLRGPNGPMQEMVYKMPRGDYALLVDAKTRSNMTGIGSAAKIKDDLANTVGSQLGSEAADYIHGLDGQVVDSLIDN